MLPYVAHMVNERPDVCENDLGHMDKILLSQYMEFIFIIN